MILLDTNILSELMRVPAAQNVIDWLDKQVATDLYISAITRAEIELGIALLPGGKKKEQLIQAALRMFDEFTGRCLPFEETAAIEYGRLVAHGRKTGRPMSVEDAQISAIALTHGMSLATRNTRDFSLIERLELINPWAG
ncbi:MAG: PIN domain-containing protein [Xanthomonadales bacterium]|nr:PIN domain-containing protein [Xanthomonadales bacterium]